jgi:dihydropyrimidinase
MKLDLVIKNGKVVTASDIYEADIGVENGKIVGIGKGFEGKEAIDAKGMLVFPGGVDVHTHLDMPFMGTTSSDDFETGTIAATFGGTTSIVDFVIQSVGESLSSALSTWEKKAEGKASIDYGFHLAMTDVNESTIEEMELMVKKGIPSFKLFMSYKGSFMSDDEKIFRVLQKAKNIGALVMFHAENGDIIDLMTKKLISMGKTEPRYHPYAHPAIAEEEATGRAISLSEIVSTPIYIAHLTCAGALESVRGARAKGLPVYAETCPQYLLLDAKKYEEPGFEGSKYAMSPPLRERGNLDLLWHALGAGDLQVVSTDHCPFFMKQKEMGKDDFSKIPNGAGGIETRIPLMYSEGVEEGRIILNRFVEVCSTAPAKLMGMYPKKGAIAPGSDADLVIFDPQKRVNLSWKTLHQRTDYTPYEGMAIKGYPVKVIVNGELKVDNGEFVGKKGTGRFIKRSRFGTFKTNGRK